MNTHLHERYRPEVKNPESIRIAFFEINIKRIRCFCSVEVIVSNWQRLENVGFPLEDITSTLAYMEFSGYLLNREFNVLKFPIHVLRIVDAIVACESIKGFDKRCNDLKSRLAAIIENGRFIPNLTYKKITDYHDDLITTLLSATDEFRIAYALNAMNPSFEFTNVKGSKYPDFRIGKYEISRVETSSLGEAKSRLNRSYIGEEINTIIKQNKIIRINEQDIVRLLCRDAYTTFETAFDEQHSNIVLVNLSHSDYGDVFASYSLSSDNQYGLKHAFEEANKMIQGVILYTEVFTVKPRDGAGIAAVSIERETAEKIGKALDKTEKDYYKKNLVHLGYYELIDEARKLNIDTHSNEK